MSAGAFLVCAILMAGLLPTDRSPGMIATLLFIGVYALALPPRLRDRRGLGCARSDALRAAMTTDRSYRKAMPIAEAVAELRAGSGTQFDPVVVDALIAAVEDAELLQAA